MITVAVINEDFDFAASLGQIFELDGFTVRHFPSGFAALHADGENHHLDVIMVDYEERRPRIEDVLGGIKEKYPDTHVILTAKAESLAKARGFEGGQVIATMPLPLNFEVLDGYLQKIAAMKPVPPSPVREPSVQMRTEPKAPYEDPKKRSFDAPVSIISSKDVTKAFGPEGAVLTAGTSEAAIRIRRDLNAARASHEDILVAGPKGVGKKFFLKALERPDQPFIEIDCAATDPKSVGDILFGKLDHAGDLGGEGTEGALDQATGGMIVLLSIDKLPRYAQDGLERVLMTRNEMIRAGKGNLFRFRVLTSSDRDLLDLAIKHQFSATLLKALSPVFIEIPALSKRAADTLLIFEAAMRYAAFETGGATPDLTPKLATSIATFHWSGELEEICDAAFDYVRRYNTSQTTMDFSSILEFKKI